MTKEEIFEKYGNVKLKFTSYYKYSFGFKGVNENGVEVYASIGGDHNDIYKLDVEADKEETLHTLDPNYVSIKLHGEKIGSYFEGY